MKFLRLIGICLGCLLFGLGSLQAPSVLEVQRVLQSNLNDIQQMVQNVFQASYSNGRYNSRGGAAAQSRARQDRSAMANELYVFLAGDQDPAPELLYDNISFIFDNYYNFCRAIDAAERERIRRNASTDQNAQLSRTAKTRMPWVADRGTEPDRLDDSAWAVDEYFQSSNFRAAARCLVEIRTFALNATLEAISRGAKDVDNEVKQLFARGSYPAIRQYGTDVAVAKLMEQAQPYITVASGFGPTFSFGREYLPIPPMATMSTISMPTAYGYRQTHSPLSESAEREALARQNASSRSLFSSAPPVFSRVGGNSLYFHGARSPMYSSAAAIRTPSRPSQPNSSVMTGGRAFQHIPVKPLDPLSTSVSVPVASTAPQPQSGILGRGLSALGNVWSRVHGNMTDYYFPDDEEDDTASINAAPTATSTSTGTPAPDWRRVSALKRM